METECCQPGVISAVILLVIGRVTLTVGESVEMPYKDFSCDKQVIKVRPDTTLRLQYKGKDPGEGGCRYRFEADGDALDHHAVCFKAESLYLLRGMWLRMYSGDETEPLKIYSVSSTIDPNHDEHLVCANDQDPLDIFFDADEYFIVDPGTENASRRKEKSVAGFTVAVSSKVKMDFSATYGPIIGGIVAIVVIATIIVVIVIFVRSRRKRT